MKTSNIRSTRRLLRPFVVAISLAGLVSQLAAQSNPDREIELDRVLSTLLRYTEDGKTEPLRGDEEVPRLRVSLNGVVRHLAASPGLAFKPSRVVDGDPEETARFFIQDNRSLLGIVSGNVVMQPLLTRSMPTRTHVRLQQTYSGVPVFAGQSSVQLNNAFGVEFLSADLSLEVNGLDADPTWTTPDISAEQAAVMVSAATKELGDAAFEMSTPTLMIFDPAVLDETGPVRLVWEIRVQSEEDAELNWRWFIDAKSGEVAQRYPMTHSALNRQVSDSSNTTAWPGTLVRAEGDPATGTGDVDSMYLFLGQTYNFFNNNHNIDSFNGLGAALLGTVRYCPSITNCPWGNAQWTGTRMRFGNGYATDDVTAHEFTHAVTEFSSGLVYANVSGAINESLSDIWGEFVDLSNASGNDAAGVRWDMGEDLPGGRLRNMQDPTVANDPDRLGSSLYVPSTNDPKTSNDFGGVHSNSGVNNKLCYLLVDGDTFNGQVVTGMGIAAVADLYFEANVNLLTSGANWTDLFEALRQAAVNIGWNAAQRNNLYRACRAVEIASPENIYVNNGIAFCLIKNGRKDCNFILGGPYKTVSQGAGGAHPGDRLYIRGGSYSEAVTFKEITTVRAYDGTAYIGN